MSEPITIALSKRQRQEFEGLMKTAETVQQQLNAYRAAILAGGLPEDGDVSQWAVAYADGALTVTSPPEPAATTP